MEGWVNAQFPDEQVHPLSLTRTESPFVPGYASRHLFMHSWTRSSSYKRRWGDNRGGYEGSQHLAKNRPEQGESLSTISRKRDLIIMRLIRIIAMRPMKPRNMSVFPLHCRLQAPLTHWLHMRVSLETIEKNQRGELSLKRTNLTRAVAFVFSASLKEEIFKNSGQGVLGTSHHSCSVLVHPTRRFLFSCRRTAALALRNWILAR